MRESWDKIKAWFEKKVTLKDLKISLLKILFFSRDEQTAFFIISDSKQKTKIDWYLNNVIWSLITILFPFLFTIIHNQSGKIDFNKSLLEILLSGSLSLTGFNIIRSASNVIIDKTDESNMYSKDKEAWNEIKKEVSHIKGRLNSYANLFSFLGASLYVVQVIQIIDTKIDSAYLFLMFFAAIFFISVIIGRLINLINTNFIDNEEVVRIWYAKIHKRNVQMVSDVTKQAIEEGL